MSCVCNCCPSDGSRDRFDRVQFEPGVPASRNVESGQVVSNDLTACIMRSVWPGKSRDISKLYQFPPTCEVDNDECIRMGALASCGGNPASLAPVSPLSTVCPPVMSGHPEHCRSENKSSCKKKQPDVILRWWERRLVKTIYWASHRAPSCCFPLTRPGSLALELRPTSSSPPPPPHPTNSIKSIRRCVCVNLHQFKLHPYELLT